MVSTDICWDLHFSRSNPRQPAARESIEKPTGAAPSPHTREGSRFLCPNTHRAQRTGPAPSEHSGSAPTPGGSAAPRTLPTGEAELQQSPARTRSQAESKEPRGQTQPGQRRSRRAADSTSSRTVRCSHPPPDRTALVGCAVLPRFSIRTRLAGGASLQRGSAGGRRLTSPLQERSAPWGRADPLPPTEPRTPEERRAAGGGAATFTAGGPAALPARSIPYRKKKAQSRPLRPSRTGVQLPTCLAPGDSSPLAYASLLSSSGAPAAPRWR